MGVYEDMLGRIRTIPDAAPFPELTPPSADPAAAAAADAAAVKEAQLRERRRFALPDKRPNILNPEPSALSPYATGLRDIEAPEDPSLNSQPAAVQLAMNDAPAGTGVPFSTQAGMLAPPVTVGQEPVPLPRARPEADGPSVDIGARSRSAPGGASVAPMQIAPQIAAPDTGMLGGASILDRIRTGLGDNSNALLALGAGFAGAPNWGQAISRAASAAIPARAADIKQKLDLQTRSYGTRALVEAGVPIQQAIAAAVDPDLKKALIKNYIEDRKHELKTVKDWMGNESLVDFDPFTSKAKPVDLSGATGADGAAAPGIPSNAIMAAARLEPEHDPVTNRDENFLNAVKKADPLTAAAIEDVAAGKMPASGRNLQKLMPLVARYEQGFEANRYSARQNLEKSYYGGGEGAKALRAANTTITHGIDLKKAIDDLHNFSVLPGFLNPATGKLAENIGDKKYQDALARFNSNAGLYARELEVALTGKSTRGGTKEIEALFDKYASPTANQAALQQTLGMLEKRVNEHENTYRTGMNKPNHTFDNDMLTNRTKLDALLSGDTGSGIKKPAAAAGGAAPKPGKYVYDPASNALVPAQ
jgi:hypothetical protein